MAMQGAVGEVEVREIAERRLIVQAPLLALYCNAAISTLHAERFINNADLHRVRESRLGIMFISRRRITIREMDASFHLNFHAFALRTCGQVVTSDDLVLVDDGNHTDHLLVAQCRGFARSLDD